MKRLINFLKGIVVGVATLVPGVSGGTMSIILGIYDDLIHSISSYFKDWKKHTLFLFEVGLGAVVGVLLFSRLLGSVINTYPVIMGFFFIGVICGGIPVLYKKSITGKKSFKDLLLFLLGFVIVISLSSEPDAVATLATGQGVGNIVFLLIGGVITAVALILPGISGSFMLYVLGLYGITLNAIETRNIAYLIPLGIGVVLGTLGTARAVENLLKKYPSKTYIMILGFVVGSLLPVFPGVPQGLDIIYSILAMIVGFYLIRWISKKEMN